MSSKFSIELAAAIASHAALPPFETERSLDDAYLLQREVTRARSEGAVGGVKAGVTAPAMQGFLKLDHALIGSLYADSRYESSCKIPYIEGRNLECEVAIIVDGEGRPKSVAPAIEIVRVQLERPSDLSAPNLVACNLGADAYIVGEPIPWEPSFNDATVTLTRGVDVLNQAAMSDALGGPEQAARWMWQEARKRGFRCEEGTLFLGGACGAVVPAAVGEYHADFGSLGEIEFEITSAR